MISTIQYNKIELTLFQIIIYRGRSIILGIILIGTVSSISIGRSIVAAVVVGIVIVIAGDVGYLGSCC